MDEIHEAQRRAQRYRYSDGIGELVTGSALALAGSGFLIAYLLDSDVLRIVSLVVAFSLVPLGLWTVRLLKGRITYPRTGYVRPPQPRLTYAQRFGANALFALIVMPLVREHFGRALDTDTMTGRAIFLGWVALMVAPLAVMAVRLRLYRLLFIVATALAIGTACLLLHIPSAIMIDLLFATTGVASVATGAWALHGYLRKHPRPELDGEHGV
jgi:hypothetical protein